MSEADTRIASGGTALAAASVLGPAIDELRWQFPELRVVCGAFAGAAVRVVAESRPPSMQSVVRTRATGAPVVALVELLETGDEFIVSDVRARVGWRGISSAILGDETMATAIVPLRFDGELVGFLRMDSPRAGLIERAAIEGLHAAAPLAASAIALEQERARGMAHLSQIQRLEASLFLLAARQRNVSYELQQAIEGLRGMVDRLAPRIEPGARIELDAIMRRFAANVNAGLDALSEASDPPPDEAANGY